MLFSQQLAALLVCVNVRFYVAIDCTAGPTCLTTVVELAWGVVLCNEAFLPALHVIQPYRAHCAWACICPSIFITMGFCYLYNYSIDCVYIIIRKITYGQ